MKRLARIIYIGALMLGACFLCTSPKAEEKENNNFPLGCHNVGYYYKLNSVALKPDSVNARQSLYFFFNSEKVPLNLYQMRDGDSQYSMHYNHLINPQQWAAFATDAREMKFICTVPDANSPYGKIVDCSSAVKICEFDAVRFGLNNRGNVWVVHSNTKNGALSGVVHYGIVP